MASRNEHRRAYWSGRGDASDGKKPKQKTKPKRVSPRRRRRARLPEPPRGVRDPRAQGTFGGDGVLRRWHAAGDRVRAGHGRARARPARRRRERPKAFRRGVRAPSCGSSPSRRGGGRSSAWRRPRRRAPCTCSSSPRRPLRQKPTRGTTREAQDPHTPSRPSSTSRRAASSWRAVGVGAAAATAKLAGAVSARLAGVALGATSRGARRTLCWTLSAAGDRSPSRRFRGMRSARAKARAGGGGFGVAGACAVRACRRRVDFRDSAPRARGSARDVLDSIRVVAVNGDALLCEYSVCLTGADKSRGPVLERERPARARAAPEDARRRTTRVSPKTKKQTRADGRARVTGRPRGSARPGHARPWDGGGLERINERVHGTEVSFSRRSNRRRVVA